MIPSNEKLQGLSIREELILIIGLFKESVGPHVEDALEELSVAMAWQARAVELYADAKRIVDGKMGTLMEELAKSDIPWGALRSIVEGRAKEERYDMVLADRTSAMLTHRIDALRTKISYEKALMENSRRT